MSGWPNGKSRCDAGAKDARRPQTGKSRTLAGIIDAIEGLAGLCAATKRRTGLRGLQCFAALLSGFVSLAASSGAAFFFLVPGGCGGGNCGSTVGNLFSRIYPSMSRQPS